MTHVYIILPRLPVSCVEAALAGLTTKTCCMLHALPTPTIHSAVFLPHCLQLSTGLRLLQGAALAVKDHTSGAVVVQCSHCRVARPCLDVLFLGDLRICFGMVDGHETEKHFVVCCCVLLDC